MRFSGLIYEAIAAARRHGQRCKLFHPVLEIRLPHGGYFVEMAPTQTVRATAAASLRKDQSDFARSLYLLCSVMRCAAGETAGPANLAYAVHSPLVVTDDARLAQRVFDILPAVPRLT